MVDEISFGEGQTRVHPLALDQTCLSCTVFPQCRLLIQALAKSPSSIVELSKICKLSVGSVEKHMQILLQAGLVTNYYPGGPEYCQLCEDVFHETREWFSQLGK